MKKITKKQHYVPQFYLKNFAEHGSKIWVYDKANRKSIGADISDIAQERYFYELPVVWMNINTLRDVYYKEGQAGVSTMDRVLKELLNLTPEKVTAIVTKIDQLEPVSESSSMWHSINATEERKQYYALVAKALSEIDAKLETSAKKKK